MNASLPSDQLATIDPMLQILKRWVLFLDPPEHTPIQKTLIKALQTRSIRGLHDKIDSVAESLLNNINDRFANFDFIESLSFPLPVIVIAELLGADPKDRVQLKEWSDDIAGFLNGKQKSDSLQKTSQALAAMANYFTTRWAAEGELSSGQLLDALHQLREVEVDHNDLVANAVALIFAGHETTTNLLNNTLKILLERPQYWQELQADRSLVEPFIQEVLRFDPPVQRITRVVTDDIEISDTKIPAGERVFLLLGAGNRDPEAFDEPEQFDFRKKRRPALSFGYGIHACPGNHLAILETRILLNKLLDRFQAIQLLSPTLSYKNTLSLRCIEQMPLKAQ
jgi:hypothetical protein